MAKATKRRIGYKGGQEGALSGLGTFFLWFGIIGFIAAIIIAGFATRQGSRDGWAENGFSVIWTTVGIVTLILGIAARVVCMAFADVIRLLKKQTGVPYGGEISRATPLYRFACSECGADGPQWADGTLSADKCANCGAAFDTGSAELSIQNT